MLTSRTLDEAVGATVLLKAENLQRTGSFKIRGATNKLALLAAGPKGPPAAVVAMSSGNHGAAVAFAARRLGVPATIVMPRDAPAAKLAAVHAYGADVVTYDRYRDDRDAVARRVAAELGAAFVPPYDDHDVMAGQGTLALELVEDAGPLDALVVCVGGGGLIAGCATAMAGASPQTAVIGAEPALANDTELSLQAGERVALADVPRTMADGQASTIPGELTFAINKRLLAGVVTATEAEFVTAMRFCFERLRVVVEPSGACALATVLAGRVPEFAGKRIGVTLSGGNIDPAALRGACGLGEDARGHYSPAALAMAVTVGVSPAAAVPGSTRVSCLASSSNARPVSARFGTDAALTETGWPAALAASAKLFDTAGSTANRSGVPWMTTMGTGGAPASWP